MPKTYLNALLLITLVAAPFLSAQSREVCSRYKNIPLPLEATGSSVPEVSPSCDSYKSYAGIGRDPDYAAAFACAWKERAAQAAQLPQNPGSNLSWVVGGSLILSDLYANGRGTPQNIPLAIHFACEGKEAFVSDAFTDLESRVDHPKATKPFDLCDYAGNTFEMNFCASYGYERSNAAHDREADALARNWPAGHKTKFVAARKAYGTYVETVQRDETYMGGTIRDLRALSAAEALQEDFAAALKRFESGKLPHASAIDYKIQDADLNRVFQEALSSAKRTIASDKTDSLPSEEEIQPAGIRKTERAWLAYRDAWVAFATLHYLGTTREAWLDELTRSRVHRLLLLACDGEPNEKLCTPAILNEIESQH